MSRERHGTALAAYDGPSAGGSPRKHQEPWEAHAEGHRRAGDWAADLEAALGVSDAWPDGFGGGFTGEEPSAGRAEDLDGHRCGREVWADLHRVPRGVVRGPRRTEAGIASPVPTPPSSPPAGRRR